MGHNLVAEFIGSEYKASVQRVLEQALLGQGTANFEFPLHNKMGRPVEILLNATPRVDSAGNLVGVVGVGQDITDKKSAEVPPSQMPTRPLSPPKKQMGGRLPPQVG